MRHLFICITFALIVISCKQHEIQNRQVIITGEVLNYDSYSEYQSIQFHINNPFGQQVSQTVYLNDKGHFSIKLKQFYPQEYFMIFKHFFSFYISPGDSIHIAIDSELLTSELTKESDKYNFLRISGDATQMNIDYFKYMQLLEGSIWNWEKDHEASINLNPIEYKNYIKERTEVHWRQVEEFNTSNNTCNQFREFVKNSVQYRAMDDLMRYRWYYPHFNDIKRDSFVLSPDYFEFLHETEFNNEDLVISNNYLSFLHEYSMYLNQEYLPIDTFKKIYEHFKNNEKIDAYQIQLNNIRKNTTGFLEQIILTKFFYMFLEWNDPELFDTLYKAELFTRPDFSNMLEHKYSDLVENLKNPEYYTDKILSDLKLFDNNILKSIINKYPNKVIYIDFWAPWCGPCLRELKYANELHEKYKNKDMVFIYLANRCSETSWKVTVAKENIKGKHLLLNDNQFKQLSDKLNISGIPHYVIINKKGLIINSNAPRPSETEKLITILGFLLDEI